jgi:hypothetical protein
MSVPVTVFTGIKWTKKDSKAAVAEGWEIFDIDSTGVLEIERDDESGKFKNDNAARAFVAKKAAKGSPLHLKALCVIAKNITDLQLETCCDEKDVASDIEAGERAYGEKGNHCETWSVDLVSQLTILRSTI